LVFGSIAPQTPVFKKGNDEPFHHLRCRKALPDVIVDLLQSLGDGTQRVGVTLIEGGEDAVLVGEEVIERANGGARLLGETMHRQARFAIALQHLRAGIQNGGDTLVSTVLLWLAGRPACFHRWTRGGR